MGVSPPGKILDRAKCSSLITVLPNGRVAWNHNPISRNAAVLGVTGYRSGIHRWTFQVNGLVITNGLGVGFTTLPVDGDDYERGWSPSTVYAWFSNQFTGGLARSQTSSTAKMAQWLNGDILTLTLNVEAQTMEMFHHHTKERKTIRLDNNQGKPLYLWIFLGQPRHRIIFLPNSEWSSWPVTVKLWNTRPSQLPQDQKYSMPEFDPFFIPIENFTTCSQHNVFCLRLLHRLSLFFLFLLSEDAPVSSILKWTLPILSFSDTCLLLLLFRQTLLSFALRREV